MIKFLAALLFCVCTSVSAWAGNMETVTLFDKQSHPDTSILMGADAEQKAKYFPDGKMEGNVLAFLVKIKGREILFDTGLPDGRIAAELKKNGRTVGDVKTILLTHLHRDHYGGLVDASGKAAFPNAAVYVSRAERAYWVDEKKDVNVIHALAQYAGRVHEFEPGDKVMPGGKGAGYQRTYAGPCFVFAEKRQGNAVDPRRPHPFPAYPAPASRSSGQV